MEKLRVYDEDGNDTGIIVDRSEIDLQNGQYVMAAVLIIKVGSKFLITKRDKAKSAAGKWEFPGGMVQAEESSKQGALRELKEETGIIVDEDKCNYLGQILSDESKLLMDIYEIIANPRLKAGDVKLQPGETVDAKILTADEIDGMYDELTSLDQIVFDEMVLCME